MIKIRSEVTDDLTKTALMYYSSSTEEFSILGYDGAACVLCEAVASETEANTTFDRFLEKQ